MKTKPVILISMLMIVSLACNISFGDSAPTAAPATNEPLVIVVPTASPKPPEVIEETEDVEVIPAEPEEPSNQTMPGEPSGNQGEVEDVDSSYYAAEKRVVSGDSYKANFFERPFTADDMEYLPDVDITKAIFTSDDDFFYVSIEVRDVNKDSGDLIASYGTELDIDTDGRGDFSVWVLNPVSTKWITSNVTVLRDSNNDIGGKDAYISDAPWKGNGYDQAIDNTQPKAAWGRVSPYDKTIVQIAVHRELVGDPDELLWGAWADNGLKSPQQFDYDDTYSLRDAGSPIKGNQYYPLDKVHSCDNTCRRPWGFSPAGRKANMCWSAGPQATDQPGPTKVPDNPTPIIIY